jgi:hypothetical protein
MKKKIYLIFLLAAVAAMTSSNTGCGGNDAKTKNASGKTTPAVDSAKSDTTHTGPIHH